MWDDDGVDQYNIIIISVHVTWWYCHLKTCKAHYGPTIYIDLDYELHIGPLSLGIISVDSHVGARYKLGLLEPSAHPED